MALKAHVCPTLQKKSIVGLYWRMCFNGKNFKRKMKKYITPMK
jgi:hypothetical protein